MKSYNDYSCSNHCVDDSSSLATAQQATINNKTRSPTSSKSKRRCSRAMRTAGVAASFAFVTLAMPFGTSALVAPSYTPTTRSSSSRTTTHQYMSLDQVSDFYQNFPVQSAVLTCGVKASVADTIAQFKPQFEEQKNIKQQQQLSQNGWQEQLQRRFGFTNEISSSNENSIDWEVTRNLAYVLYGGIFVGLMSHVEYNLVFPVLFGTEKTLETIFKEVFFDNLIVAPVLWLPPAYFIKAWVYSASGSSSENSGPAAIFQEGLGKYITDVKENQLLLRYWSIWFPAHSISFSVVPDHLRVAFMASISFFWFILFSSISSKGDAVAADE